MAAAYALDICKTCGVIAPVAGTACDVCRAPLASVRRQAPALPTDLCWVAVRAGFTCNSCRFLAPLDSLDADGAVECAHCGLRQRFDIEEWAPALELAHAVGDLAGPNPEGRNPHPAIWIGTDNPHAKIGVNTTFEHLDVEALSLDATPGFPLCNVCKEPLQIAPAGPGACQATCPRCGDRAAYAMSDAARSLSEHVLALISDDSRSDRPRVRMQASSTGISLNCPSCGAPLTVSGTSAVQTCGYCRASSIVPHRNLSRALAEKIEPSIWWLLFRGPSPKRLELQEAGEPDETSGAGKTALKLIGKSTNKPIGEAAGVYEAPEEPGFNLAQMLFTVVVGALALLLAFALTRILPVHF